MGRTVAHWAMPRGPRGGPHKCLGCHVPIVYGERCPECANQAAAQAVNRERRNRGRHRHDLAGQAVERKREHKHRKRR
jgi:hypothetical protein